MPNAQRYCHICSKRMRSDHLKRHIKWHNQSSQGDLSIPLEIVNEELTGSDNLKRYINQHNQNSPGDLSIPLEMVKEELRGLKGSLLTLQESLARIENHVAGEDNFNTLKKHKIVCSQTSGVKNNIFTSVDSGDLTMSSQAVQSENSKENCSSNKLQEHEVKHSIIISGIEISTDKDMSILEIENYAKNLNIDHFQGVYDIDRLPDKHKEEECGIVRLTDDPSRWACYYKDSRNCFFFDSLGRKTPLELQKYLKTERDFKTEKPVIQRNTFILPHLLIHMSGQLCLSVLRSLLDGQAFDRIIRFTL